MMHAEAPLPRGEIELFAALAVVDVTRMEPEARATMRAMQLG